MCAMGTLCVWREITELWRRHLETEMNEKNDYDRTVEDGVVHGLMKSVTISN